MTKSNTVFAIVFSIFIIILYYKVSLLQDRIYVLESESVTIDSVFSKEIHRIINKNLDKWIGIPARHGADDHMRLHNHRSRSSEVEELIAGVQGEVYPCKPDIFEATYEKAINAN